MKLTTIVLIAVPAVHIASILLGRRCTNRLERTAFYSGLAGFASAFLSLHFMLRDVLLDRMPQTFEASPSVISIALAVGAFVLSLGVTIVLLIKRRGPNNSFKPTPLRGRGRPS